MMLVLMSYLKVVDLEKFGNIFHELCVFCCLQIPVQAVEMPGSMNDSLDVQVSAFNLK